MDEDILVRIVAPHFCAGIILRAGVCIGAAPILKWALGQSAPQLEAYCRRKRWTWEPWEDSEHTSAGAHEPHPSKEKEV